MGESKLASNVYMGSGSPYAATLTSSRPDMLISSKEGATALTSASTTTTGTGLGLAKGAGAGIGLCKVAAASGLAGAGVAGTIIGAVVTGGVGLLVGYLTETVVLTSE